MSIIVKGSGGGAGGEDLTAVLTEQNALIQEIEESLVGKASGANITPETVLAGYRGYRGKTLVEGTFDPATADPDLIAKNIRKGIDIFGVIGTLIEGVSGIRFGKVTYSSDQTSITITHGMGSTPSKIYLVPETGLKGTVSMKTQAVLDKSYIYCTSSAGAYKSSPSVSVSHDTNTTTITFQSGYPLTSNTYYWFVV